MMCYCGQNETRSAGRSIPGRNTLFACRHSLYCCQVPDGLLSNHRVPQSSIMPPTVKGHPTNTSTPPQHNSPTKAIPITSSAPNSRMATITQSRKTIISKSLHGLNPGGDDDCPQQASDDLQVLVRRHTQGNQVLIVLTQNPQILARMDDGLSDVAFIIVDGLSLFSFVFDARLNEGDPIRISWVRIYRSEITSPTAIRFSKHVLKSVTVGFLPVREETPKLEFYLVKTKMSPPSLRLMVFPDHVACSTPFVAGITTVTVAPEREYVPLIEIDRLTPACETVPDSLNVLSALNVILPAVHRAWPLVVLYNTGNTFPSILRRIYDPTTDLGPVASPPHAAIALHNNPRPSQRPVFIAIPSEYDGDSATAAKQAALISRPPDPTVRERAPKHADVADVTPFSGNSVVLAQSSEGQNQDARRDQQQGAHAQESIPSGFLETPADLGDLRDQFLRLPFVHRGALRQCERQTSHFSGSLVTKDVPNWRIAA